MGADHRAGEPRWHALIAILAVGGLTLALPPGLTLGPRWLFPTVIGVLLVPTVALHRSGRHQLDRGLGFVVSSVMTLELVASVVRLVTALPSRQEGPTALLVSAASIWVSNILVFAVWYWRLDAGGPHGRDAELGHVAGAFLFPQLTMLPGAKAAAGQEHWSPNFVDYLFLAFNTSTAFSPTDTPVLRRWGKLLMMLQSLISLTVLALLAGRAVNIL
jgi:hypothetical protein